MCHNNLIIHNVVIAGKHAPPVRPRFYRFRQIFFRLRHRGSDGIVRPAIFGRTDTLPVAYVNVLRAVRAIFPKFAIRATVRRALRFVFGFKKRRSPMDEMLSQRDSA